jgi:hypothetical protein
LSLYCFECTKCLLRTRTNKSASTVQGGVLIVHCLHKHSSLYTCTTYHMQNTYITCFLLFQTHHLLFQTHHLLFQTHHLTHILIKLSSFFSRTRSSFCSRTCQIVSCLSSCSCTTALIYTSLPRVFRFLALCVSFVRLL